QEKRVIEQRTFHRTDAAGVRNRLWRQAGVFRKRELGIGALQFGIIENGDLELARFRAGVFHVIAQVAVHFGNAAAEDRVVEVLRQRQAALVVIDRLEHQRGFTRQSSLETRQDYQAAAALDARVARGDDDAAGRHSEKRCAWRRRV